MLPPLSRLLSPPAESAVEVKEETAKVEVVTPAKAEEAEKTEAAVEAPVAEDTEQKAEEAAAEQPAEAAVVAEESASEEAASEAPAAEESAEKPAAEEPVAEEPEVAPEPVKTISDLQREKLQEPALAYPHGCDAAVHGSRAGGAERARCCRQAGA